MHTITLCLICSCCCHYCSVRVCTTFPWITGLTLCYYSHSQTEPLKNSIFSPKTDTEHPSCPRTGLCWPYYIGRGDPHDEEPQPHHELDSCQCPFPWFHISFSTWDLKAGLGLFHLNKGTTVGISLLHPPTLQAAGVQLWECFALCQWLPL